MSSYRRVAFLPDTFHEINGVAHTSRQFQKFVRRRQIPFLSVHCGRETSLTEDGAVRILELERGPAAFALDTQLDCDPFLIRHAGRVLHEARRLAIEAVHITGPGDLGLLGWYIASRLRIPLVMGWHTNLHEYADERVARLPAFLARQLRGRVTDKVLALLRLFYRHAAATLAPNRELVDFVHGLTGRPSYLMARGVDMDLFSPAKRSRSGGPFRIGYVGRLTAEKNVRFLATLGQQLQSAANVPFEFYLVGQGSDSDWLRSNVPNAILPGVLTGEALAKAYADLDLFVFPSKTDTFGNVILEALASGVPCVVTANGGPRFLVQSGVTGYVARDDDQFIDRVIELVNNPSLLQVMRPQARAFASSMSWDSVFEGVFAVYNRCCSIESDRSDAKQVSKAALSAPVCR